MTKRLSTRAARWLAALLIVTLTAAGALAGWALEQSRGERWEASTEVLVNLWAVEGYLLTGQSNQVTSQDVVGAATYAASREVLDAAAARLGGGLEGEDLEVLVTPETSANAVAIVAHADDGRTAQRISEAVGAAMVDGLQQRIAGAAAGLVESADDDLLNQLQQRVLVLTQGVAPLQPLTTPAAEQIAPTGQTPIALGIVGLAAGTLLAIALLFGRPVVRRARDAQRLLGIPAVPFGRSARSPQASTLLRRLLQERPEGDIVVVPVVATADKRTRAFVDWARQHSTAGSMEVATRIVAGAEPAATVLAPRPSADQVAAVVLAVPPGTRRRDVTDAAALLAPWHPAEAVVVLA